MKKLALITIFAVLAATQLRAQDKMTVPFPSATQPRKLVVDSTRGSVTVRGYDGQEAIIETSGSTTSRTRTSRSQPPPGMHRIGPEDGSAVQLSTDGNTLRVNGKVLNGPSSITIQVPKQTSVTVKTMSGKEILIENISGEIEANNMSGQVNIVNVSGSVVAHSMNGKVTASLTSVTPGKAMSFSTFNGDVDVTLPAAIKANVKMKTDRGDMFTDFDIQLNPVVAVTPAPATTATKATAAKAATKTSVKRARSVRVRTDRTTSGSINGGGPEIQFTSYNGDILIHKK